jgi:hypothetical protein
MIELLIQLPHCLIAEVITLQKKADIPYQQKKGGQKQ